MSIINETWSVLTRSMTNAANWICHIARRFWRKRALDK